jgi:uncharacterized membrane protein YhaH (DUF805 family)
VCAARKFALHNLTATWRDAMNWYLDVLKKYVDFDGRARRKEYWMFFLINTIISFALMFVVAMAGGAKAGSMVVNLYSLAVLLPSVAVGVRRMHDTDHSGWWILLPIVNLIFACTEGTRGPNRFGADPKLSEQLA